MFFQVGHGIGDHREIFFQTDLEDLGDMQCPRFADDGYGGGFGIKEHFDLRIVLDLHLAAAGHAEGGDLSGFPRTFGGFFKEGRVLGV